MSLQQYNPKYSLIPAGFNNLGFTCYYNSLLQSLLSCTSFVQELLEDTYDQDIVLRLLNYLVRRLADLENPEITADQKDEIIQEINRLGPITWRAMIQKLAKKSPEFAHFAMGQQCAAEGFSLLLQSIEEYDNIQNLFMHRRRNKLFCDDCKSYFSQVDEMNNLFEVEPTFESEEISADSKRNLNEFLLNQKNKVDENCICSKCQVRSEKVKTSTLVMIPEILFVMSKKYKYNRNTNQGEKLDIYTDFPEHLVFKSKANNEIRYSAVAQIEHYGNLNGGHYLAICKRKNGWFCLNDNSIGNAEFKPTNNTYIVLYHVI
jgi:ubiquitin C-terminal hydrolase